VKSWELLRKLFAPKGAKYFTGLLGRSRFLVHKWTEPAGNTTSGARNPLDALALLMAETDAARVPAARRAVRVSGGATELAPGGGTAAGEAHGNPRMLLAMVSAIR